MDTTVRVADSADSGGDDARDKGRVAPKAAKEEEEEAAVAARTAATALTAQRAMVVFCTPEMVSASKSAPIMLQSSPPVAASHWASSMGVDSSSAIWLVSESVERSVHRLIGSFSCLSVAVQKVGR